MNRHIERGSLVRLRDGKGLLVCVLQGELWVTQEGDPRDYLVRAGERLRLERRGAVVASALSAVRVTMTQPGGRIQALRQWLVRAWAGAYAPFSRPTTAAL